MEKKKASESENGSSESLSCPFALPFFFTFFEYYHWKSKRFWTAVQAHLYVEMYSHLLHNNTSSTGCHTLINLEEQHSNDRKMGYKEIR